MQMYVVKSRCCCILKLAGWFVDGMQSMDGREWHIFLITNFWQSTTDRNWTICHHFTHKQNLYTKFPEMTADITVVSETVNCVRSKGINNCQFVDFLNDVESVYGDTHYCVEVHWLYCGGMVCKSETKLFLELCGKPFLQLCSHYRMWNFAFCFHHLIYEWTGPNMKLQGENHNVNDMFDKITVFKRKVQLWDLKMWSNNMIHFLELRMEKLTDSW